MQTDERARFLADLTHSLRTPLLTAIRRSDIALRRDQPTRQDLLLIRALCTRMWAQISSFRAMATLTSNGQVQPNLAALTAREIVFIVNSVVQDAQALTRSTDSHRFEIHTDADDSTLVEVDIDLFEMALRELIDNAVKYSLVDGRIEIGVRSHGREHVDVTITNQTVPVSPDEVKRFLERGWRSPTARRLTPDGLGIGLWLVQAVMQAQKGSLSIESSGKTVSVTMELPSVRHQEA